MEFAEKLQKLRKHKGLTQEELAERLYVSRTAISKWESGRGYPNIDSIKEIAAFFSITIDELLSSEKILYIAEKENKRNIQKMCNLLFGIVDLFTIILVVLPLYPKTVNGHIYSVNLFEFAKTSSFSIVYWIIYLTMTFAGIIEIVISQRSIQKCENIMSLCSLAFGVLLIVFLTLTRQVYATIIMLALLIVKGVLYLKHTKVQA